MKKENKFDIKKLQNHLNNSNDTLEKGAFKAKTFFEVGDRVHLKNSYNNGTVLGIIFKKDRKYPYLKIKWDIEPSEHKQFYDPFEITKEIKIKKTAGKVKKVYDNWYVNNHNNN